MTTSREESTYQGWTNYETWAVKLWADNEQCDAERWADMAREALANPEPSEVLTPAESARFMLADQLKTEAEENMPELNGVWADLLSAALSEVNWDEIAGNVIEGLEE